MPIITLEYSPKQGCFHISDIETVCKNNKACIMIGRPTDYLLIGLFNSYDEADRECDRLKSAGFGTAAHCRAQKMSAH